MKTRFLRPFHVTGGSPYSRFVPTFPTRLALATPALALCASACLQRYLQGGAAGNFVATVTGKLHVDTFRGLVSTVVVSIVAIASAGSAGPEGPVLVLGAAARPLPDARRERPELFGEGFDLVCASSVLAFVDDYEATVATMVEGMRPGALFFELDWELDESADEPFGLARERIRACLEGCGLERVRVTRAFEVEVEGDVMSPLLGFGRVAPR